MKYTLAFVILILSSFSAPRCGATVYHSDGSAINVQLIHDTQAVNGDTITLPAGIFLVDHSCDYYEGITIQGQTTTNSDNGTANDQTVLIDNLVHVGGDRGIPLLHDTAGQLLRITGITFTGVGGIQTIMPNGAIRFFGNRNVPVPNRSLPFYAPES